MRSVKLPPDYNYAFNETFEELNFSSKDGGLINPLLFKSDSSHGVICFWKGNGGNCRDGGFSTKFLMHNYDVIIADYREHGKSRGAIAIDNFHADAQTVYNFLKMRYSEDQITVVGYSLGTSMASRLSTQNNPLRAVLIEPRHSALPPKLMTESSVFKRQVYIEVFICQRNDNSFMAAIPVEEHKRRRTTVKE